MGSEPAPDNQLTTVPPEDVPSTFNDKLGVDIVDIFVGPSQQHFKVHQKPLCTIPYFFKMLLGPFKESIEQTIRLPEDDPAAFALFLEYLYGGNVLLPADLSLHAPDKGPVFDRVKLWCFAEKVGLKDLQDYLMSGIMTNYNKLNVQPSAEVMGYVHQNSLAGSAMRLFVADGFYWCLMEKEEGWSLENLGGVLLEGGEDFVFDFLGFVRRGRGLRNPITQDKCAYHTHPRDMFCKFKDDVL